MAAANRDLRTTYTRFMGEQKLDQDLSRAVSAAIDADAPVAKTFIAQELLGTCPIRNDHPSIQVRSVSDMLGNWLVFLPAEAVRIFRLEPNFTDKGTTERTMWMGRLGSFRRIRWLQHCAERSYSLDVPGARVATVSATFDDAAQLARLVRAQAMLRGAVARRRSRPEFLTELVGCSIRSIMAYVHGSGGMTWANARLCRIAASAGCVVIAPDHMSSAEWRAKVLRPLHTSAVRV